MNRDKKLRIIYRLQDVFAWLTVLFFGAFVFNLIYWFICPYNDPLLTFIPFISAILSLLILFILNIWEDRLW